MPVHESAVNYANLIRDLAEMYPTEIAEVVVIELLANSLDAKAQTIRVSFDNEHRTLVVEDDGDGMDAEQFVQYHDFAMGLKTRGDGIGFAGVGAKISFNVAERVLTETRSESFCSASDWYLLPSGRLVWEEGSPEHLRGTGTRVEVRFNRDTHLPFASSAALTRVVRRHYLPLLDRRFLELYSKLGLYPENLRFVINGNELQPESLAEQLQLSRVTEFYPSRGRTKVGYGFFGLSEVEYPLGAETCGVVICTRGKAVKAELFNQFPGEYGSRVVGVVEIPPLVKFLTTSKTDFIRRRYKEFEQLYGPVREAFRQWLRDIGVQTTAAGTPESVVIERELRKILDQVPELSDFLGIRAPKDVLTQDHSGEVLADLVEGGAPTFPVGIGVRGKSPAPAEVGCGDATALLAAGVGARASKISRTGRKGPRISFSAAAERSELAWVEGSEIVVNSAHPCYTKHRGDARAAKLHCLFAVGLAVQKLLSVNGHGEGLDFVDRMMAAWGKS